MPEIDFSNLMGNEPKSNIGKYDFSGLMETPTIKPLSDEQSESYTQKVLSNVENVDNDIEQRGTLWNQYNADTSPKGIALTFLKNISLPANMIESSISNPIIELQKGNLNPIDLMKESFSGLTGMKRGEYKDVAKNAGLGEVSSEVVGLAYNLLTPAILASVGKKLSAVSKFADKRIFKAAKSFLNTVEKSGGALNKVGSKVGRYYDDIGSVSVDKAKFLDELSNMSTSLKKAIVDMPVSKIAQVEDELLSLAGKGDINAVHQAKEVIDDVIVNYFSATSNTQKALRKHGKTLNNIIDSAVHNSKTRQIGSKAASKYVGNFQKARKDYSQLKSGFGYIRKKLINPMTGQPTKTGSILREISDPRNIDVRTTLGSINKFGTNSNKFARELNDIENAIKFREFTGSAVKSAGRGLVIGATAGQILKRTNNDYDGGQ